MWLGSLIGYFFAWLAGGEHLFTREGAKVYRVRWLVPTWAVGQTWGGVILVRGRPGESLLEHELVHVEQWRRWSILFPVAYILAGAWAWIRYGKPYEMNAFEVEAENASNT